MQYEHENVVYGKTISILHVFGTKSSIFSLENALTHRATIQFMPSLSLVKCIPNGISTNETM